MPSEADPCDIIILGASGDLSQRKLLPALFSLYCKDHLPKQFRIIGFARTKMTNDDFRQLFFDDLVCRYAGTKEHVYNCQKKRVLFQEHCTYYAGNYDSLDSFRDFDKHLRSVNNGHANRIFYMSVPPSVFLSAAHNIAQAGMLEVPDSFWSRAVLEKPFGRDSESSQQLTNKLKPIFSEKQLFRIDHYLGKEVIQNLLVLRFANSLFEPLWNRDHIKEIRISFSEEIGCEGRAGYFDSYGIIRDVVQNHLLQVMALVAAEQPLSLDADDIADEKARVLRCVRPLSLDDVVTGQYTANDQGDPGYLDDPQVPNDSLTETFADLVLHIDNPRWSGVPFHLQAGKGLPTHCTSIHIKFKSPPHSIFYQACNPCQNDIHIRIQPDEAIELHLASRVPGLNDQLRTTKLNMLYRDVFDEVVPEAYERLLLDVIRGDRGLFIQPRELAASWAIVTPVLNALEQEKRVPLPYPFGSNGPTTQTGKEH